MARTTTVLVLTLTLLAAGCGAGHAENPGAGDGPEVTAGSTPRPAVGEHMITETVAAPSLADNLLGDPAERTIMVYLPPTYDDSDERYPVVYFLAGYEEEVGMFAQHREDLWEQMQQEGMRELIIVEVDGVSALGGNFYANSPVSGNAEDFLTVDLVAYVDSTYRTIPQASARGLSGFSMGGSGTVNVGLAHPDVYAALYANSPGLLAEDGGLEEFLESNGSWRAYGAAFAPDPAAEFPHIRPIDAHAPLADQDPGLVAAWESGYGNLRQKVADYLAQPQRLREIKVAYGTTDIYRWIPTGSEYFLGLLEENGVPHSSSVFDGGHGVDYSYFEHDCVEFFSRNLTG